MEGKIKDLLKSGVVWVRYEDCAKFIEYAWYRHGISVRGGDSYNNGCMFVKA